MKPSVVCALSNMNDLISRLTELMVSVADVTTADIVVGTISTDVVVAANTMLVESPVGLVVTVG